MCVTDIFVNEKKSVCIYYRKRNFVVPQNKQIRLYVLT